MKLHRTKKSMLLLGGISLLNIQTISLSLYRVDSGNGFFIYGGEQKNNELTYQNTNLDENGKWVSKELKSAKKFSEKSELVFNPIEYEIKNQAENFSYNADRITFDIRGPPYTATQYHSQTIHLDLI